MNDRGSSYKKYSEYPSQDICIFGPWLITSKFKLARAPQEEKSRVESRGRDLQFDCLITSHQELGLLISLLCSSPVAS